MPKAKSYKILRLINVILDIFKNDSDIANRTIYINSDSPQTASTKFYKILPLEYISNVECPAISVFTDFNIAFIRDSSAAKSINFKMYVDVAYENYDTEISIEEAYKFAEDVRETLEQKRGLNGNVSDCTVISFEEIGAETDDGNPFRFAFRLILEIKTR